MKPNKVWLKICKMCKRSKHQSGTTMTMTTTCMERRKKGTIFQSNRITISYLQSFWHKFDMRDFSSSCSIIIDKSNQKNVTSIMCYVALFNFVRFSFHEEKFLFYCFEKNDEHCKYPKGFHISITITLKNDLTNNGKANQKQMRKLLQVCFTCDTFQKIITLLNGSMNV